MSTVISRVDTGKGWPSQVNEERAPIYMCASVYPIISLMVLCGYMLDLEGRGPPKHQSDCGYHTYMHT